MDELLAFKLLYLIMVLMPAIPASMLVIGLKRLLQKRGYF